MFRQIMQRRNQSKQAPARFAALLCAALIALILGACLSACQSSVRFSSSLRSDFSHSEAEKTAAAKSPATPFLKRSVSNSANRSAPRAAQNLAPAQEKMLDFAYSWLSVPYRYGNATRAGTDCSGFTMRAYEEVGVFLPRSAREQYNLGRFVTLEELEAGDLLFFNTTGRGVSHVGLYVGEGAMIHASIKSGVVTQELGDGYYSKTFVAAKRLL